MPSSVNVSGRLSPTKRILSLQWKPAAVHCLKATPDSPQGSFSPRERSRRRSLYRLRRLPGRLLHQAHDEIFHAGFLAHGAALYGGIRVRAP